WPALCRTRDSERPRGGATGFAALAPDRLSRCRARFLIRVPSSQGPLQQSEVLSAGARAAPSRARGPLRPFVEVERRPHVLCVLRRAPSLRFWFGQSSAQMIATPTDLHGEVYDHQGS